MTIEVVSPKKMLSSSRSKPRRVGATDDLIANQQMPPSPLSAGIGQLAPDTHGNCAIPAPSNSGRKSADTLRSPAGDGRGHLMSATQRVDAAPTTNGCDLHNRGTLTERVASENGDGGGGRMYADSHEITALTPIVSEIVILHRERRFRMKARLAMILNLYAYARACFGWQRDATVEDRAERKERAKKTVDLLLKGKPTEAPPELRVYVAEMRPTIAALGSSLKEYEKRLTELAESLPAWKSWGESVRGFGPMSLASIIGETGDLAGYANPAKVWARLGLAPGLKRGARRAIVHVVGDCLVKQGESYRDLYLSRKEYETPRLSDNGEPLTKMHAHLRAMRYMEKRLLLDLWKAWRAAA